jgi:WD40 repeat protein
MKSMAAVWDVTTAREVRRWTQGDKGVRSVAWSPDGRYILFGGMDGAVFLAPFVP